jgi:hypothetical protein
MNNNLTLIILISCLLTSITSYGQELFVVHAHRHYIKKNYSSFRYNEFSKNLKMINNYFCQQKWDKYWVYDTEFFPKRDFPIKKCGAKKLKSKWGDITHYTYKFSYKKDVVLTGIYFGNCLSRTYRSIYHRFLNDNQTELIVHIPMPATISYYSELLQAGVERMINHPHFLKHHNLEKQSLKFRTDVYYNGQFIKKFEPQNVAQMDKTVQIHLWDKMDEFVKTMDLF